MRSITSDRYAYEQYWELVKEVLEITPGGESTVTAEAQKERVTSPSRDEMQARSERRADAKLLRLAPLTALAANDLSASTLTTLDPGGQLELERVAASFKRALRRLRPWSARRARA
jgi:hypothetical protein